jgi:hypothetical protein
MHVSAPAPAVSQASGEGRDAPVAEEAGAGDELVNAAAQEAIEELPGPGKRGPGKRGRSPLRRPGKRGRSPLLNRPPSSFHLPRSILGDD